MNKYELNTKVEELLKIQLDMNLELLNNTDKAAIPGIEELLKSLMEKSILIGIGSSSPRAYISAVINKLNIKKYFDVILSGEEVTNGKPHPELFLTIAKLLDVEHYECVVIEDSRNGIIAAKDAGMKCIGFNNPNSGYQDISNSDLKVNTIKSINIDLLYGLFSEE